MKLGENIISSLTPYGTGRLPVTDGVMNEEIYQDLLAKNPKIK